MIENIFFIFYSQCIFFSCLMHIKFRHVKYTFINVLMYLILLQNYQCDSKNLAFYRFPKDPDR